MPTFDDTTESEAPIEEVWKLLYDPTRFTEWWEGVERIEPRDGGFTMWPDGYPDFPMPQQMRTDGDGHKVLVSCLVSDLVFEWRLEPLGERTRIAVHVEIPEAEAARLDSQRDAVRTSMRSLAALAST